MTTTLEAQNAPNHLRNGSNAEDEELHGSGSSLLSNDSADKMVVSLLQSKYPTEAEPATGSSEPQSATNHTRVSSKTNSSEDSSTGWSEGNDSSSGGNPVDDDEEWSEVSSETPAGDRKNRNMTYVRGRGRPTWYKPHKQANWGHLPHIQPFGRTVIGDGSTHSSNSGEDVPVVDMVPQQQQPQKKKRGGVRLIRHKTPPPAKNEGNAAPEPKLQNKESSTSVVVKQWTDPLKGETAAHMENGKASHDSPGTLKTATSSSESIASCRSGGSNGRQMSDRKGSDTTSSQGLRTKLSQSGHLPRPTRTSCDAQLRRQSSVPKKLSTHPSSPKRATHQRSSTGTNGLHSPTSKRASSGKTKISPKRDLLSKTFVSIADDLPSKTPSVEEQESANKRSGSYETKSQNRHSPKSRGSKAKISPTRPKPKLTSASSLKHFNETPKASTKKFHSSLPSMSNSPESKKKDSYSLSKLRPSSGEIRKVSSHTAPSDLDSPRRQRILAKETIMSPQQAGDRSLLASPPHRPRAVAVPPPGRPPISPRKASEQVVASSEGGAQSLRQTLLRQWARKSDDKEDQAPNNSVVTVPKQAPEASISIKEEVARLNNVFPQQENKRPSGSSKSGNNTITAGSYDSIDSAQDSMEDGNNQFAIIQLSSLPECCRDPTIRQEIANVMIKALASVKRAEVNGRMVQVKFPSKSKKKNKT